MQVLKMDGWMKLPGNIYPLRTKVILGVRCIIGPVGHDGLDFDLLENEESIKMLEKITFYS